MELDIKTVVRSLLQDRGIETKEIEERSFPGELWLVVFVDPSQLSLAQSVAGQVEQQLNSMRGSVAADTTVIAFRPTLEAVPPGHEPAKGRLFRQEIDQLIQLLEARSRTSDALPSLKYVEDPRASLSAVCASRHHLVYGRRGVGKTALLLEAKRWATNHGYAAAWLNAHTFRNLDAPTAAASVIDGLLVAVIQAGGTSTASQFKQLSKIRKDLAKYRNKPVLATTIDFMIAELNIALRNVLREDLMRLYVFIDDFYLFPIERQPQLLDSLSGVLRDANGWLKIASIERLTRPYEPSSKLGLELPHDASRIDLDVTLEDPAAAQKFLEHVLSNYLQAAGIKTATSVAKREAFGRLVLASGGVPRDYLNLLAGSIVVARSARPLPREVGREDVARAAGSAAQSKKKDLEQDVSSQTSATLLRALDEISTFVRSEGYAFFRVDAAQSKLSGYETLAQLVDLRFMHLVQLRLSDQHKPGAKYESYVLDLSEYSSARLKRNLHVLDLKNGQWTLRQTGNARSEAILKGTQLRDRLREAPLVDLQRLGLS